jgi:hypothetical protein
MKRLVTICCLIVLLILGGISLVVLSRRPHPRPSLDVFFLGYTNTTAGARLALFSISNASPWAVVRQSHYTVQSPVGNRWARLAEDWIPGVSLRPAASEVVTITAPTNQPIWRVAFSARKDEGMLVGMTTELLLEGQKLGLPTRYRRQGFAVFSESVQQPP